MSTPLLLLLYNEVLPVLSCTTYVLECRYHCTYKMHSLFLPPPPHAASRKDPPASRAAKCHMPFRSLGDARTDLNSLKTLLKNSQKEGFKGL